MKYLRPLVIIAAVTLFFMFMNYTVILHKSSWKLAIPLRMGMFLLGIFILIVLMAEVWQLTMHKANITKKNITVIVFLVLYTLLMIINPFGFPTQPKIKLQGYWQGSTSSGHIVMYTDKVFEIRWNGLLRGGLYAGEWTQNKDTFYLDYNDRIMDRVGKKIVYHNNYLSPVDGVSGLLLRQVNFKCNEEHD